MHLKECEEVKHWGACVGFANLLEKSQLKMFITLIRNSGSVRSLRKKLTGNMKCEKFKLITLIFKNNRGFVPKIEKSKITNKYNHNKQKY